MFDNDWGGAVAMTKIKGIWMYGPWVMNNPDRLIEIGKGNKFIGDGECVAIAQATLKMPLVKFWKGGKRVLGNGTPEYYQGHEIVGSGIVRGTVIATMDEEGNYPNNKHGNHVAIYLGQGRGFIEVIDQWNIKDKTGKVISHRYPKRRNLYPQSSGISDNANAFSVVFTLQGGA